jgi:hypothetical protein
MSAKLFLIALCLAPNLLADLTLDQKLSDFQQLAGIYAKNYGPYQWKRDVIGFDLYNIQPWIEQVKNSKTDLDYYDICVKYVASLQDSHDEFTINSDFTASLHFDVDIYDGAVLIDGIDRTYLPSSKFPFQVGDAIVSVDGGAVGDLITKWLPYAVNGGANPVTRRRIAADNVSFRYQGWNIRAHEIGDTATIVVQRQNGNMETYTIPWDKSGTPIVSAGPVTSPLVNMPAPNRALAVDSRKRHRASPALNEAQPDDSNPWGAYVGPAADSVPAALPEYALPLEPYRQASGLTSIYASANFGSVTPVFNPPAGFKLRLGSRSTDQFLSGTFPSGTHTFGLLRIYTMSPTNTTLALTQFQAEIAYFQQNTDGLVVDIMRNGGGSLCYAEQLAQYLIPSNFRSMPLIIRSTDFWVENMSAQYFSALRILGKADWHTQLYGVFLQEVKQANSENRGDTGNVPLCYADFEQVPPARDAGGNLLAYTKPILVTTDEYTLSAAETFSANLQDAHRATFFGMRTDGGGSDVVSFTVGVYAEGRTRVSLGLETRATQVSTPGFPATNYIENVGVYPDIVQDYMTKDNLLNGGATFLNNAVAALVKLLP